MDIVVFSGGTGGHVFPAVVVCKELSSQGVDVRIVLDARGSSYCDIEHDVLPTISLRNKLSCGIKLFWIALKSMYFIAKHRPKIALGFGGIASVIPMFCCRLLGVKTVIHEQNAVMGRANRFLKKFKMIVCSSYDIDGVDFLVRTPVRNCTHSSERAVDSDIFSIFVLGGSQGAKIFDDILPRAIEQLDKNIQKSVVVTQQVCDEDRVRHAYDKLGIKCNLKKFFDNPMDMMRDADIIIARAGASTISEAISLEKACIFIPYPHSQNNHQKENAKFFVERGAALCVCEDDSVSITSFNLARSIEYLYNYRKIFENRLKEMNMRTRYTISDVCRKLLERE